MTPRSPPPRAAATRHRRINPRSLLAVLSILVGTVVALLLVPQQPQQQGALLAPALVLALSLVAQPLYESARGGIKRLLGADKVLLVGIIYWLLLDLIQGLHDVDVADEAIHRALLACGLFGAAIVIGTSLSRGWMPRSVTALATLRPTSRTLFNLNLTCFSLGIFYYLYSADFSPELVWDGLFRSRWEAPWSRGEFGGWTAFIEHLSYFGYLMPGLTVLLAARERTWLTSRVIVSLLCVALFAMFVAQSGSRRLVGVLFGVGLLTSAVAHRERLTVRHAFLLVAFGLATLLVLNVLFALRGTGLSRAGLAELEFDRVRVDDNFFRLAQTIELVPERHPHSGSQWLIHALVRPVPRVIWPGKPTSPGFVLQDVVDSQGASLTSSIVGEAYAAFGWLGILGTGLVLGWLAGNLNHLLEAPPGLTHSLVFAIGVMALFAAERALIELVLMSYPLLALWALYQLGGLPTVKRTLQRGSRLWRRAPRRTLPGAAPPPQLSGPTRGG